MTTQEAIERIKYRIYTAAQIAGKGEDGKAFEDLEMAIEALDRLDEYERSEEPSSLIRLPIRIGQTLYTNQRMQGWYLRENNGPYPVQVEFIGLNNSEVMGGGFFNVAYQDQSYMIEFNFSDIGNTIFFTESEADLARTHSSAENR